MSRAPQPRISPQKTFFQQKWAAKAEVRQYHGEHLTNRQWQNIFRHTMKASVPMQNTRLAIDNGSEMAMGRGSGLQGDETYGRVRTVPYMSQLFWPMERRLDMAVHRAMFASSARQGRQFVVHGFVKVNGKKVCLFWLFWWGREVDWVCTDGTPRVYAQPWGYVLRRSRPSPFRNWEAKAWS